MASPRLQTRVNQAVERRVEEYQERAGEPTKSDAVRRLIVKGLETESIDPVAELIAYYRNVLSFALVALVASAGLAATTPHVPIAFVGMMGGFFGVAMLSLPISLKILRGSS